MLMTMMTIEREREREERNRRGSLDHNDEDEYFRFQNFQHPEFCFCDMYLVEFPFKDPVHSAMDTEEGRWSSGGYGVTRLNDIYTHIYIYI